MINVPTIKIDILNAFRLAFRINTFLTCPLAISDDEETFSGSANKNI